MPTYNFNGKMINIASNYAKEQNHTLPANFSNSLNSFVPERNWDETNFPGLIRTKDGLYIFQTSGHSCQFSDGTKFISNPESEANIKKIWDFLTVEREFREIPCDDPGIKLSASIQYMKEINLQKLASIHDCAHLHMANGNRKPFFLVSFMVIDALIKMGLRDRFPRVICGNATKETQRSKPDEKVWDLMNMGY